MTKGLVAVNVEYVSPSDAILDLSVDASRTWMTSFASHDKMYTCRIHAQWSGVNTIKSGLTQNVSGKASPKLLSAGYMKIVRKKNYPLTFRWWILLHRMLVHVIVLGRQFRRNTLRRGPTPPNRFARPKSFSTWTDNTNCTCCLPNQRTFSRH